MIKSAYSQFALALSFLSRIPMLPGSQYSESDFARSNRWFPLAGWLLGSVQVLILWLALQWWSPPIAALLTLGFALWLTGCFHEDGLADSADGLLGYVSREKAFSIMKDSRLGTYGASALIIVLLLKWLLWVQLCSLSLLSIIAIQALSRWAPLVVMNMLHYAEVNVVNRKPSATSQSKTGLVIASLCALPALFLLHKPLICLAVLLAVISVWRHLLQKRLGGWTGDTLGALQIIAELALLLIVVS